MEKLLLRAKEDIDRLIAVVDNLTAPMTTPAEEEVISKARATSDEIEKLIATPKVQ